MSRAVPATSACNCMATEIRKPQVQTPTPTPQRSVAQLHLWQITPIRDVFWIGLGIAIVLFTYWLRSIFTPVLIGLILAYIFNPLIGYFEQHWRVPRPVTITVILAALTVGLASLLLSLLQQFFLLAYDLPEYVRNLVRYLEEHRVIEPGRGIRSLATLPVMQKMAAMRTPQDAVQMAFDWTSQAFGYLGTVIQTSTYVIVTLLLIPIYFFSFAWRFDAIVRWIGEFIPPLHRERTLNVLGQMDQAVSGFFRGRLVVAIIMSGVFMLGWYWAGVPYWLLLGVLAGILNIVPYLVTVVWPLAILLTWLDYITGGGAAQAVVSQPAATQPVWISLAWMWPVIAKPTMAYVAAQFLDNWFITPIVQARSSNLSAVTIIIVVLAGGAVGGLYGLLLAIPIAACFKILAKEVLIPHLQKWAQET